jgi:hypothetical protein
VANAFSAGQERLDISVRIRGQPNRRGAIRKFEWKLEWQLMGPSTDLVSELAAEILTVKFEAVRVVRGRWAPADEVNVTALDDLGSFGADLTPGHEIGRGYHYPARRTTRSGRFSSSADRRLRLFQSRSRFHAAWAVGPNTVGYLFTSLHRYLRAGAADYQRDRYFD